MMKVVRLVFKIMLATAIVISGVFSSVIPNVIFASATNKDEIIIDFGDKGYSEIGAWSTSSLKGYNGSSTRSAGASAGPSAEWRPTITATVSYDVYIYKVVEVNSDPKIQINISYNGGEDTQSLNYTEGTSGWVFLGNYPFAAGDDGFVKLTGKTYGKYARADAVKFVESDNGTRPNTAMLEATILTAQTKVDAAVAGGAPGQYPQAAIDSLKAAIAKAAEFENITIAQLELDAAIVAFDTAKIQAIEIVIDYGDEGYTESGDWLASGIKGHNDTSSRYIGASYTPPYVEWRPTITHQGNYDVYIYKIIAAGSDPETKIEITSTTGTTPQTLDYTVGSSGWTFLGSYSFDEGNEGAIKLLPPTSGKYARADAVMFVKKEAGTIANTLLLEEAINAAQAKVNGAAVGDNLGQYPQAAINTLRAAIDKAIIDRNNTWLNQLEVDSATTSLNDAVLIFEGAINSPAEFIIDYGVEGYTETGEWRDSDLKGYSGSLSRTAGASSTAEWKPNITKRGKYDVYLYKVVAEGNDPTAKIEITSIEGTSNQTLDYTAGTSEWVFLGNYSFESRSNGAVKLLEPSIGRNANADAVKFVQTEAGAAPNKVGLEALISKAQARLEGVVAGNAPGQYPQAAIDALKAAINKAIADKNEVNLNQIELDKAIAALTHALVIFKEAAIPGVNDEIIIDYGDDGYKESSISTGAKWSSTTSYKGYNNSSTRTAAGSTSPKAQWTPEIKGTVRYDVYIYKVVSIDGNPKAKVKVMFKGGSDTQTLDYTAGSPEWVLLGNYLFEENSLGYVKLSGASGTYTRADAVKFVRNDREIPLPELEAASLEAKMAEATALLSGTVEGTSTGQYASGSKVRLQEEIASAAFLLSSGYATAELIHSIIADLNVGMALFRSALNAQIRGSVYTIPNPNVDSIPINPVLIRQSDLKNTLTRYLFNAADYALYSPPQGEVSFGTEAHWKEFKFPNRLPENKQTVAADEYYQYNGETPRGMTKIKIYKYAGVSVDDSAVVTIYHNGKTDTRTLDMNTDQDGWYELGDYFFSGTGDEYVRITRGSTDNSKPTVTLAVSYEVMRDRTYRDQNEAERTAVYSIGYSEIGNWQNSSLVSDNEYAVPKTTTEKDASAVYNPGALTAGEYEVFTYIPARTQTGDNSVKIEIFHDAKIETIVFNQTNIQSGWYPLGEFVFTGEGNEFVKMTKLSDGGETIASSIKFTMKHLNGVSINSTIITTNSGDTIVDSPNISMTDKVRSALVTPGLFPHDYRKMIDFYKDAPYGKYYIRRAAFTDDLTWNPVILEPGEYKISYFIPANTALMPDCYIDLYHNGKKDTIFIPQDSLVNDSWHDIGTFDFAAGTADEYFGLSYGKHNDGDKNLKYFSAFKFEKVSPNNAIIKESIATSAKYFDEQRVDDVSDDETSQVVNAMAKDHYLDGFISDYKLLPDQLMTRSEFVAVLTRLLNLSEDPASALYADTTDDNVPFKGNIGAAQAAGLLYGVDAQGGSLGVNQPVDRTFAAIVLSNVIDYTGKYLNVDNFFASNPAAYLQENISDDNLLHTYALQDAFARLLRLGVVSKNADNAIQPNQQLTRADAIVMLNEFDTQLLSAGPDLRFDWHMAFFDEFNDSSLDWSKWTSDNAIRFPGVSGRWAEGIEVKDGVLKLKNEVNNRVGVPYSSASVTSNYMQRYGYYEARYGYPNAYGQHTSYWTKNGNGTDYNWNEGTGQDEVSMNIYFLPGQPAPEIGLTNTREYLFSTDDNNMKELHVFGGYMEQPGFYMAYDKEIPYRIDDVTPYVSTGLPDVPFPNILSTVVTSFDGKLDLNVVDGTEARFDWVRNYLKTASSDPDSEYPTYQPILIPEDSVMGEGSNQSKEFILRFNKQMNRESLIPEKVVVTKADGGDVPTYMITQISPLRFKLSFNEALEGNSDYVVNATTGVKDILGNSLAADQQVTFHTGELPVDQMEPTWPTAAKLSASNVSKNSLTVSWTEAMDDTLVTSYKIYKNGSELVTLDGKSTKFDVKGLAVNSPYTFKVEAGDATGNWSSNGPNVHVTTEADSSGGGSIPVPTSASIPTATPKPDDSNKPVKPTEPKSPQAELTDIAEHWAKALIEKSVELGFVNGYEDGTFKPNRKVTRGEFATMIARALNMNLDNSESSFMDADETPAWAKPYIQAIKKVGFISGYEDGTFRANKEMTRSELVTIIVRALGLEVDPNVKLDFKDAEQVPVWARPYVATAVKAGLIKGYGDGKFNPNRASTRAEAITLVIAMLNAME